MSRDILNRETDPVWVCRYALQFTCGVTMQSAAGCHNGPHITWRLLNSFQCPLISLQALVKVYLLTVWLLCSAAPTWTNMAVCSLEVCLHLCVLRNSIDFCLLHKLEDHNVSGYGYKLSLQIFSDKIHEMKTFLPAVFLFIMCLWTTRAQLIPAITLGCFFSPPWCNNLHYLVMSQTVEGLCSTLRWPLVPNTLDSYTSKAQCWGNRNKQSSLTDRE